MIRALLPLLVAPALGIPATTTLTLVEGDPAFNRLRITVDPDVPVPFVDFSDSDTTTLTGSVTARFDVDPETHQTSELTLTEGRAYATAVTFSRSIRVFLVGTFSYTVNASDLSAAVFTLEPPGSVDPAAGTFDASEHAFSLDSGSLSGEALDNPIDIALSSDEPLAGAGSGTGQVTLNPTGISGPYQIYEVSVTLPIATSDSFDADGTSVGVTSNGTLKAIGTLHVPRSAYLAWTIEQGITDADPTADANGDGLPNAFAWAYGLAADEDGGAWRPAALPGGGFSLELPPGGTVAPIRIKVSTTLEGWTDLPATRISGGRNPLPAGSAGNFAVTPSGSAHEFLKIEIDG